MDWKKFLSPTLLKILITLDFSMIAFGLIGLTSWSCPGCSGCVINFAFGFVELLFASLMNYLLFLIVWLPIFALYLVSCWLAPYSKGGKVFLGVFIAIFMILLILSMLPIPMGFGLGSGIVVQDCTPFW